MKITLMKRIYYIIFLYCKVIIINKINESWKLEVGSLGNFFEITYLIIPTSTLMPPNNNITEYYAKNTKSGYT